MVHAEVHRRFGIRHLALGLFVASCGQRASPPAHPRPQIERHGRQEASAPADDRPAPQPARVTLEADPCVEIDTGPTRYPNEISDLASRSGSAWSSISPLVSTASDVRDALGDEADARTLADYTGKHPPDSRQWLPVLIFHLNDSWDLYVYFVGTMWQSREAYPPSYHDKVSSLDLIPTKPLDVSSVVYPSVFKSKKVRGADASWVVHRDEHGLSYEVYTGGKTAMSRKGLLHRISYGPRSRDVTCVMEQPTSDATP